MKKQFTKTMVLILTGIFATTMAFAQGAGGHDHTNVEKWKETLGPNEKNYTKGPEWELFHFPEYETDANGNPTSTIVQVNGKNKLRSINYYNGGQFDKLSADKFLGKHWKGHTIDDLGSSGEIFLCNMATGEYLQIGDYWGTNEMTNHAGITYKLTKAYSQRKKENNPLWNKDPEHGYWLAPQLVGSDYPNRVVGRVTVFDGEQGHFERNKYFVLRDRDEYMDGKHHNWQQKTGRIANYDQDYDGSAISDPGAFLFYFKPVEKDGKQAYVIYTHRQTQYATTGNPERSEFWDRESYLLLKSAGHLRTGYNAVRFEKFAGQMSGRPQTQLNVLETTFSNGDNAASTTYGTYANEAGGSSFTTKARSGMAGATISVAYTEGGTVSNSNIIKPNGNNLAFYPGTPSSTGTDASDALVYRVTLTAPSGYLIRRCDYSVSSSNSNIGGIYPVGSTEAKTWINGDTKDASFLAVNQRTLSFDLKFWNNYEPWTKSVIFKKLTITLVKEDGSQIVLTSYGDDRDNPLGDEVAYVNAGKTYVSLSDDVWSDVVNDDNNLWKIVTKEERERFRFVASEEKPADMTYRIYNPKFYTSYTYVWSKAQAQYSAANGWTYPNDRTSYHWQWLNRDRETPVSLRHHVHPYDLGKMGDTGEYDPETDKREYHKIGTGFNYRFWAENIGDPNVKERAMTLGHESNYVGSIWKGTANLRQVVGSVDNPLREGLYVVCVKGFFAPHDMMAYYKDENGKFIRDTPGNTGETTSAMNTGWNWYKQAIITNGGEDNGKWRRSHDSYLFAWSKPNGETAEEVRRMLPSIYEGAVNLNALSDDEKAALSKEEYLESDDFKKYSQLGVASGDEAEAKKNLLKDATNFAQYDGAYFSSSPLIENTTGTTWSVPKTLSAAGRWFNVIDGINETSSAAVRNIQNYRIALPVYVGPGGELTIGVDHTKLDEPVNVTGYADLGDVKKQREITVNIPASGTDEWVCFDDFELIYLGKVEPDEFVIDERHGSALNMVAPRLLTDGTTGEPYKEGDNAGVYSNNGEPVVNKNNTQWKDIFSETDIRLADNLDATTVKTVVVRRMMTKDGFSSIVLPVDLTYAQAKEGFGEGVQISRLDDFNGRIIQYKAVQKDAKGNPVSDGTIVIEAGVPYIIKPSLDPVVPAPTGSPDDIKYDRPSFTKAYSTSEDNIAGYYLRDFDRNYEVEIKMDGPIYVIPKVTISTAKTFPEVKIVSYDDNGETKQKRKRDGYTDAEIALQDSTWTTITPFNSRNLSPAKYYKINRSDAPGRYYMKETAVYHAGEKIPPYSYYWAAGKMYYTREELPTTRGLFSYLQLIREEDGSAEAGKAYSKPFIDGADTFIEVYGEISGVEDVNAPEPDGKLEIYDLMGRKVKNPRPGTIYIMNGVKVMWK